jgi:hypothetical protein
MPKRYKIRRFTEKRKEKMSFKSSLDNILLVKRVFHIVTIIIENTQWHKPDDLLCHFTISISAV